MRLAAAVLLILTLLIAPGVAATQTRLFTATPADIRNPERGFWRFLADDFAKVELEELDDAVAAGLTVGYAVVRLDAWRTRALPASELDALTKAFARTRATGMKVILRFVYNYPADEQDYLDAKDAPLDVVLGHIAQLKPLLAANADVILVWQAGFIGAWGEGHQSSNKLTTPKNKAIIRDALLAALPKGRMLQWRYPPDVMRWSQVPPPAGTLGRIGLHNDCFLSSPDDVGTYDEDPAIRTKQRAYAARLSRATIYGGETCDAEPSQARRACAAVLREGPQFHVSVLNRDYSARFIRTWIEEGCFAKVRKSLGYRLELVRVKAPTGVKQGGVALVRAEVRNVGWSRVYNPRPFRLVAVHRATGRTYAVTSGGDIRSVEPEDTAPDGFLFRWAVPRGAPTGAYDLALALPDGSPRLASDPRQAIRFANAGGTGAGWDGDRGVFELGMSLRVDPAQ